MSPRVVVLGAGIVGLSTALNILERLPTSQVNVIADAFNEDTTSYIAAGAFRCIYMPKDNRLDLLERICRNSFSHYWHLATGESAKDSGVSLLPMVDVYEESNPSLPLYSKVVKSFKKLSHEEVIEYGFPSRFKSAFSFTTTIIESKLYLPYLTNLLKSKGCQFIQGKLNNLDDVRKLSLDYDIVVNCTGLGSRELFNDKEVYPVRGQIFKVKAPWIRVSLNASNSTYFYVTREGVVVGGVRQKNDWDKNIRTADSEHIIDKAAEFYPSIRKAEVIKELVGLRPTRDTLRIEIENIHCEGGTLPVVHNYGHGAHGISLSWGSAIEAASLVEKLAADHKLKSRL